MKHVAVQTGPREIEFKTNEAMAMYYKRQGTRLKQLARQSYLCIQFLATTRWLLLWTRPRTQAAVSRLLAEWLNVDWARRHHRKDRRHP